MTNRRALLQALALAAIARPLAGFAQQAQKVRKIGYLHLPSSESGTGQWAQRALRDALRRVGYEEGKNLVIEWRWGEGSIERLSAHAEDLVQRKVELIIAFVNDEIAAAKRATATIPIVMLFGAAPVETGFVQSLARPGGNITGTAYHGPETATKILQLLKEAAPGAVRIALLWNPSFPGMRFYGAEVDRVARSLGVSVQYFDATKPDEVPAALGRIAASRPDAFFCAYDPVLDTRAREIGAFLLERKLVSIGSGAAFVTEAGGLLSYAPDLDDVVDRMVSYVDRILRGAKPAELPVELPRKFEFLINAKAARAIGYRIPPSLLARADRVLE